MPAHSRFALTCLQHAIEAAYRASDDHAAGRPVDEILEPLRRQRIDLTAYARISLRSAQASRRHVLDVCEKDNDPMLARISTQSECAFLATLEIELRSRNLLAQTILRIERAECDRRKAA